MIKAKIVEFLKGRGAKPGETVEYGWFILRVTGSPDAIDVETLDFLKMASFTDNLEILEKIHLTQMKLLSDLQLEPEWCTLRQFAVVSNSYEPGENNLVLVRQNSPEGNDSGWYVGVEDDPCDVNDPKNLKRMSLYELCLHDSRLSTYWLLPQGYSVSVGQDGFIVNVP